VLAHFRRLYRQSQSDPNVSIADPDAVSLRKALLRAYRRHLMFGAISGRFLQKAKVARRRYARNKTQKLAKILRRGTNTERLPKSMFLVQFTPSPILDSLVPSRRERWIHVTKRDRQDIREIKLESFSLLEYPKETISAIKHLAKVACTAYQAHLHFDDEHCIDIASYLVLAEVWPALSHVYQSGRISTTIQDVINAIRLRKALTMRFPRRADSRSDVWAFPLQRRRPSKISKAPERDLAPQTREKVADKFCDALNDWLAVAGLQLTDKGRANYATLIGELLDNAERHSELSKDGSWSIVGFMARRREHDQDVYRCYMAFLSEGVSIADSLKTADQSVRKQVDDYCQRHRQAGQSEDTLATLMALQDTITRDPVATAKRRGGTGFQEVLDFLKTFSTTESPADSPRFTMISGGSCIQLRPPYIFGQRF